MGIIKRQVDIAHDYIRLVVKNGDVVVDATAGNGNDTLFLSKLVGGDGVVYSFDIQDVAINNTKNLLKKENRNAKVKLIKDSHANIKSYVNVKVKCVMFNLGYLPCGDHNVVTKSDSTITAIKSTLEILDGGGIVTIIIYYGHDGGEKEKNVVLDYISSLDTKRYIVQKIENINCTNDPPILIVIEKSVPKNEITHY